MSPVAETLTLQPEAWVVATAAAFVLLTTLLAILAMQRSAWQRGTVLIESLRILIMLCLAATALQPEWQRSYLPEHKPLLAILHDESASMDTEDLPGTTPNSLISRRQAVQPLIAPQLWQELEERFDLLIQGFSSTEDPPEQASDLHHPLHQLLETQPHLAAVLLLSDGDRNSGPSPAAAATRLRMKNVPVFAVPIGSETRQPDIEIVGFDVPAFAVAGKPLRIPFSIESTLPREERITLELSVDDGAEQLSQSITLPAMGRIQDTITWQPKTPGSARLKLTAPALEIERNTANNSLEAPLDIRKEELRVLIIESFPRWEYRYLRNALERDPGIEVSTLLFHPDLETLGQGRGYLATFPSEETLAAYDVIFLGDIGLAPDQLNADQCSLIHKLVRDQATGLVFLPGLRGAQATLWETPLEELLPIVWDAAQPRGYGSASPGRFILTETGTRSLLTKLDDDDLTSADIWASLPGFQWYAPALRAKAGSEILATHGTESTQFGRVPLITTKTFGAGKILFMGADGAWRWRRGVEDKYHYRFWGQVVRWMAYQRNMARGENIRLFYAPDRPRTGGSITLNANVITRSGEPLRDGAVIAQIVSPAGRTNSIRLISAGDEAWGLFTSTFTPTEPGDYQIRLSSADAEESIDTVINVQGSSKEKIGYPARPDILAEISQLTRGQLLKDPTPAAILAAIRDLPQPDPIQQRLLLWAHPLWIGFIILLLAIFWISRKAAGKF
jgi:uncharacterized membrane protein